MPRRHPPPRGSSPPAQAIHRPHHHRPLSERSRSGRDRKELGCAHRGVPLLLVRSRCGRRQPQCTVRSRSRGAGARLCPPRRGSLTGTQPVWHQNLRCAQRTATVALLSPPESGPGNRRDGKELDCGTHRGLQGVVDGDVRACKPELFQNVQAARVVGVGADGEADAADAVCSHANIKNPWTSPELGVGSLDPIPGRPMCDGRTRSSVMEGGLDFLVRALKGGSTRAPRRSTGAGLAQSTT